MIITGPIQIEECLSADALHERYRGADHTVARSHFQNIWLRASGSSIAKSSAVTGYSVRWIEMLARRYNAGGPDSLGDRRRANEGAKALLTADQLASLAEALASRPPNAGLWTVPRVAAWIAGETGRAHVHPQRGWAYLRRLDQTWQTSRPCH